MGSGRFTVMGSGRLQHSGGDAGQGARPERTISRLRTVPSKTLRGYQGGGRGRELAAADLHRTFNDPNSELSGRDLYKKLVRFRPKFGFLCCEQSISSCQRLHGSPKNGCGRTCFGLC